MPLLTPQVVSLTGLTPSFAAAVASTTLPCDERHYLHVKNTAGSSMTVTLTATAKVRGQSAADVVVTVPATTGEKMIGPIAPGLVADHLCRNRDCINPHHVEPVEVAENTRRGMRSRGRLTPHLMSKRAEKPAAATAGRCSGLATRARREQHRCGS